VYIQTWDEFSAGYLGYQEDNNNSSILDDEGIPSWLPIRSRAVAQDIDYRALGHVTSVKNQGGCGSCVPFAATACLESSHSLWHGRVHHDLSEQELVDCSKGL
jgi:C1A family cysteine protease